MSDVTLYCGDCYDVIPTLDLERVDAVITDPPYGEDIGGMNFTNSVKGGVALRNDYNGLADWDKQRIDLAPFLKIQKTLVIWGGNFYSDVLPTSRGWLVWDKKNGGEFSNDFADCEIAWTNREMPARLIRHVWHGMIQQNMKHKEKRYHPTQKPVPVMRWCIELMTKPGETIFDPFMGSGSTGVAAVSMDRNFIGIEKVPAYYEVAKKRIEEAQLQLRMEL